MAMPWSRAKAKAKAIRSDATGKKLEQLNQLFNSCFRIQREASKAAGRCIPLVVENVCGAQPWVGKARGHFGSFYLWGNIPARLPFGSGSKNSGFRFDGSGKSFQSESVLNYVARDDGIKQGGDWFDDSQPWISRKYGSKSPERKQASAMIAKIPKPLARHIAKTFYPTNGDTEIWRRRMGRFF